MPGSPGLAGCINQQEGRYTLYLRGRENGEKADRKRVISSVSRYLNPYEKMDFNAMMEVAASDSLEYVVSNTPPRRASSTTLPANQKAVQPHPSPEN